MAGKTQHILSIIELEDINNMNWERILTETLAAFDCTTGSIHTLDPADNTLHLKAQQGIPEFLLPKMTTIPVGKGMAGVAAQRMEPVQMCNLQTDESGVARPSAKETKVEGSMAAPMIFEGRLYGTFGIAKPVSYDFSEEETKELMEIGEALSKKIEVEV
jgi:putative methionine-R-sulfoxide reductase with GAF domain